MNVSAAEIGNYIGGEIGERLGEPEGDGDRRMCRRRKSANILAAEIGNYIGGEIGERLGEPDDGEIGVGAGRGISNRTG